MWCRVLQRKPSISILAIKKGQTNFYCSVACSSPDRKIHTICEKCGINTEKTRSDLAKYSGKAYCSRSCANSVNNKQRMRENHPNWKGGSYRKKANIQCCEECSENRYFLLVVHHLDGDRDNNNPLNLVTLCYNCHAIYHMKEIDGVVITDYKNLASPSLIEKIRFM